MDRGLSFGLVPAIHCTDVHFSNEITCPLVTAPDALVRISATTGLQEMAPVLAPTLERCATRGQKSVCLFAPLAYKAWKIGYKIATHTGGVGTEVIGEQGSRITLAEKEVPMWESPGIQRPYGSKIDARARKVEKWR